MHLDKRKYSENDIIKAELSIKNIGAKAGSEVVQLYIKDLLASVSRPIIELKGFQKVNLEPGESKDYDRSSIKELKFLDENMNWVVEKRNLQNYGWKFIEKSSLSKY